MTSEKVEGLECTRLTKLAIQFWLTKDPFNDFFFWVKEIQIWMGKDSMRILEGLINFIEDLIARNQSFRVNLGVNWKKLKFGTEIGLWKI